MEVRMLDPGSLIPGLRGRNVGHFWSWAYSDVVESLNYLAELYRAQGRYGDAEPLYKRSLAISEKH